MSESGSAGASVVVRAAGLGKRFKLYRRPLLRALEWATLGGCRRHEELWVLREATLEVRRGEVLGVLGRNGAGKTTLLRLVAGTLMPSEGSCKIDGDAVFLQSLHGGLNPLLTGRVNVLSTASLLRPVLSAGRGYVESVREFAEIGDFFDRPVWSYSAGMRARLAFALYASLEPDLLIMDEALVAGDVFFQEKCLDRLAQLVARGTAIMMASHNLRLIRELCDEVLVLERGRIVYEGDAETAIAHFTRQGQVGSARRAAQR